VRVTASRHLDAYLPLDPESRRLFSAIRTAVMSDLTPLVESIIGELQEAIPAYASVAPESLFDGASVDLQRALDAVCEGRGATAEDLAACEAVGELRAQQGAPVEALIRAFQIGSEETLSHALAEGERLHATPRQLLAFSRIGWSWANEAMTSAALAHRRTELELARRDVHQRDELLRRIVTGSAAAAELQLRLPLYRFDASGEYVVVRARCLSDDTATAGVVEQLRRSHPTGALVGMVDGDVVIVAREVPRLPDGYSSGVGGPGPLLAMQPHFEDASRALETASAFHRAGSHRLEDLGLLPGVVVDRRLGELLVERCLAPLGGPSDRQRFGDTLEALFANGLRVGDAARALFVHENTVRKRLAAAESRTGMSVRRIDDLVAWWWALRYSGIQRRQSPKPDTTGNAANPDKATKPKATLDIVA
jgi:hypothetical protein